MPLDLSTTTSKQNKKKRKDVDPDWLSYCRTDLKLELELEMRILLIGKGVDTLKIGTGETLSTSSSLPLSSFPTDTIYLLGCWDGLIALYHRSGLVFLYNPNIDDWIVRLMPLRGVECMRRAFLGLCYDADEDDYIALICDFLSKHELCITTVHFKSGIWRTKTQLSFSILESPMKSTCVIVKGIPYWSGAGSENIVLRFDPKTEEMHILPQLPTSRRIWQLGSLDGQLTATVEYGSNTEIWALIEYPEYAFNWTPLFTIKMSGLCMSPLLWMIKGVELLLLFGDRELRVYNILDQNIRFLSLPLLKQVKSNSPCLMVPFLPSLTDPRSFYIEGSLTHVAEAATHTSQFLGVPSWAQLENAGQVWHNKSIEPMRRPMFGKIGQQCVVTANHFLVQSTIYRDIYHYDVSISAKTSSEEITSKTLCKRIMFELTLNRKSKLNNRIPAYDGKKSLYTAGPLPFKHEVFEVSLRDEERTFVVVIKEVSKIDVYDLHMCQDGEPIDNPQGVTKALNLVLREATPMRKSFSSTTLGRDNVGDGVESSKGYYLSIRSVRMGLSLIVDSPIRPFCKPKLLTLVADFLNRKELTDQDHPKVNKALKGILVKSLYMRDTHRINKLSVESADRLLMPYPSDITVSKYFFNTHGIKLQYPFLPCIICDKEPLSFSYMPMELCELVDEEFSREQSIIEVLKNQRYNKSQLVATEFGIEVSEETTLIGSRILPAPKLRYFGSQSVTPEQGQWRMNDKQFVVPACAHNWTCLNFSNLGLNHVERFCINLVDMCCRKGMQMPSKPVIPIRAASSAQIGSALREVHNEALKSIDLLIVILPNSEGAYETIKRICETELGIISQCCNLVKYEKYTQRYIENLSYKMNLKAGGSNICTGEQDETLNSTLIFGAHVTHAKPDEFTPSVAAVVSYFQGNDYNHSRASISSQPAREEIIQDLFTENLDTQGGRVEYGGMIRELIMAMCPIVGHEPKEIIYYRSGVSEGKLAQVLFHEVCAIKKACQSIWRGYTPNLIYVVVQKKHRTRLFPSDPNLMDRSGNILPGTIVDTAICHPTQYDFYLCSHAGIKGTTSRPTHYHVLLDETNFTADMLQQKTYGLCYTNERCTRSGSIVSPVYYARLAAHRALAYIKGGSGTLSGGPPNSEARPFRK